MAEKAISAEIEVPEGVTVTYEDRTVVAKGPNGEARKYIFDPTIAITPNGAQLRIEATRQATKREKAKVGTYRAHIANLIKGVTEGFTYKLKICSGHFPMNVSVSDGKFIVKNFLGEKTPRTIRIKEGATVKVDGQDVIVEATNRETAGQVAADIEQLCRITNRDRRIFQDGIYIVEKAGKEIK